MMCKHPLCAVTVGAFAAVGAVGIAMMMTQKGRNILGNMCQCACGCMKTAGTAAEDIASEMKNCFCAENAAGSNASPGSQQSSTAGSQNLSSGSQQNKASEANQGNKTSGNSGSQNQ